MYLSTAYPLSERSGVNLRGDFNKDNVTHFEGEDIEDVEPEEGRTELSDAEKEARFYCQFWGMQRFFSNPPTLFVEGNLEKLRLATEATLTRFEAISGGELPAGPTPSGSQSGNSSSSRESASASMVASRKRKQRPDDKALGKEETFYFPKFLTSPKLFDLELRDPNFRRHILLQILIVSQYLLLQSPKERERLTEYLAATKNGTGAPKAGAGGAPKAGPGAPKTLPAAGFTLAEQEIRWLDQLRVRCTKTLELLPGNGRAFMKTILGTLSQEKAWIKWKLESCNSFERPGLPLDLQMHSKRRKAEQLPAFLKKDAWLAANAPAKDPLARLKDPLRNPTLEGYMDEIREDLTEYEDREERRASDPRTQWKVWRLVRQGGMPAFYRMAAGNKEKSKEKEKAEREKAEKDKAAKEKAKSEPVKDGGEASGTATPVAEAQPVGKDIGEDGEKPKEQEAPGYPDLEEFLAEWDRENGKQRLASVKMEVDKS